MWIWGLSRRLLHWLPKVGGCIQLLHKTVLGVVNMLGGAEECLLVTSWNCWSNSRWYLRTLNIVKLLTDRSRTSFLGSGERDSIEPLCTGQRFNINKITHSFTDWFLKTTLSKYQVLCTVLIGKFHRGLIIILRLVSWVNVVLVTLRIFLPTLADQGLIVFSWGLLPEVCSGLGSPHWLPTALPTKCNL